MIDFNSVTQLVLETKKFFKKDMHPSNISKKGPFDYVTDVDYQVQEFLCDNLSNQYPKIKMLSEEQTGFNLSNDVQTWILDPVDGTANLMHQYREFAISLALFADNVIIYGCIFNPITEELFSGIRGEGAFLNGNPIHCSSTIEIKNSLISVETAPYNREDADINFSLFKEVFLDCQDIRCTGSSALSLAYLAAGRTDAFIARQLKSWDYAAGSLILVEAGGEISDWKGNPLNFNNKCHIIASNKKMHATVAGYLKHRK